MRLMHSARQRQQEQLFTLGCLPARLGQIQWLEMGLLALLTAALGTGLGYGIANALLFDMNRTLVSLYGLQQALTLSAMAPLVLVFCSMAWRCLLLRSQSVVDDGE